MKSGLRTPLVTATGCLAVNWASLHFSPYGFEWDLLLAYAFCVIASVVFERFVSSIENPAKFTAAYMIYSSVRLISATLLLLIYALLRTEYLLPFAISFAGVYLVFTAVEVVRFITRTKRS